MQMLDEERLSFAAAAKHVGVHVSTIWRWALRGCRGHKLESVAIGWQRFTSHEAIRRFVERINADKHKDKTPSHRSPDRESAIERAEHDLSAPVARR